MDATKPFLELLNEKQWPKILILILVVAGITLWLAFNSALREKDIALARSEAEKEANTKFWLAVVAKKDSIILAEKEKSIMDRDKQIAKFEAKTEKVDRFIDASKQQDTRLKWKTQRNNRTSKVIEEKLRETTQQ